MDEGNIDEAVDAMVETISEVGDDMTLFTMAEALAFYEGVAGAMRVRVETLRSEMGRRG